jgi:pimeloyl-ACP methyl ester carboxylesterase
MPAKPNIILVHGAWVDASSWTKVIEQLQAAGYSVVAVQLDLASLDDDIARTRSVLAAQGGPTVLVGHSYGGAVITAAAAGSPHALSLVYASAFAPAEGEASVTFTSGFPPAPGIKHVIPDYRPGFLRVDPAAFPHFFMPDVAPAEARALATTQKAIAGSSFSVKVRQAAWRTLPSWYLVAENDLMVNPDAERATAKRIGATTIVVRGSSHASPVSHPDVVAGAIMAAARAGA